MDKFVEYDIIYKKESEKGKAWLVVIDGLEQWVPKSQVKINETQDKILISEWFDKKRLEAGALFDDDKKHRFVLWRTWNKRQKTALVIGLNPSTANGTQDDPTINRLKITLNRLGYGGLLMVNLFSVISSDPEILLDKQHQENEKRDLGIIFGYALAAQEIIFAWGTFQEAQARAKKVIDFFVDARCFGKNKDGSPWHPQAMMYAGLKPDSSKIFLFKYSDHTYENNIYDRKQRRQSGKKKIKVIPAEFNHKQGEINF